MSTQPTTPPPANKLDTVRKLLAKAERAGTPEEAEAFSAKATELMQRYSIDAALAGEKPDSTDKVGDRRFEVKFYAKPKVSLLSGIAQAFGCQAVYYSGATRGTLVVKVYGWESDLAMVEVLFASLNVQADREAETRWLALYWENVATGRQGTLHGKSFKTSFYVGFAQTVASRLRTQRAGAVREAEDSTPGTALVLVDRKKAVDVAFRRANPNTHRGTGSSTTSNAGYYSGKDAGNRADLGTGSGRLGAVGSRAIGPATR